MNANGGQLKQLTEDLPLWSGCSWSPDGTQIAYPAGNFDKEGADIFTMDVDGNNIRKITDMGGVSVLVTLRGLLMESGLLIQL